MNIIMFMVGKEVYNIILSNEKKDKVRTIIIQMSERM